jgi:hypothetical protein
MWTATVTINLVGSSVLIVTDDECTGKSLGPGKTCGVSVEYAPTSMNENHNATLVASGEHASASATLEGATVAALPTSVSAPAY